MKKELVLNNLIIFLVVLTIFLIIVSGCSKEDSKTNQPNENKLEQPSPTQETLEQSIEPKTQEVQNQAQEIQKTEAPMQQTTQQTTTNANEEQNNQKCAFPSSASGKLTLKMKKMGMTKDLVYTVKVDGKISPQTITIMPPSLFKPMFGVNEIHYTTHILKDSCTGIEVLQKTFIWNTEGQGNLTESINLERGCYCLKIADADAKIVESSKTISPDPFTLKFAIN